MQVLEEEGPLEFISTGADCKYSLTSICTVDSG